MAIAECKQRLDAAKVLEVQPDLPIVNYGMFRRLVQSEVADRIKSGKSKDPCTALAGFLADLKLLDPSDALFAMQSFLDQSDSLDVIVADHIRESVTGWILADHPKAIEENTKRKELSLQN